METSPASQLPPQDGSPSLDLLPLFLSFIFCPTSFRREWAAFLDGWCPLPVFRSCFVVFAQHSNDLLMNLWGRKWSPHSYSSAILGRPSRIDWFDLLAVQGTLKSLLQQHSLKVSILRHSAFFIVQLTYLYVTTGKTIALTIQTFVGKVMSPLFNILSRFVIAFLPSLLTNHIIPSIIK